MNYRLCNLLKTPSKNIMKVLGDRETYKIKDKDIRPQCIHNRQRKDNK